MTQEQYKRAGQLEYNKQLLDNILYTLTSDSDYNRLSEKYKKAIQEAFEFLKIEIKVEFQKL